MLVEYVFRLKSIILTRSLRFLIYEVEDEEEPSYAKHTMGP